MAELLFDLRRARNASGSGPRADTAPAARSVAPCWNSLLLFTGIWKSFGGWTCKANEWSERQPPHLGKHCPATPSHNGPIPSSTQISVELCFCPGNGRAAHHWLRRRRLGPAGRGTLSRKHVKCVALLIRTLSGTCGPEECKLPSSVVS